MHRVERGPEPDALSQVKSQYTPRWVQYYRQGVGNRPTDSHRLSFRDDLRRMFFDLCAYCEALTQGEVDHLKPKNK